MNLELLWFVVIALLFTGFFVLEGFDYGVGMLLPFLGRSDSERSMMMNAIGPFWDGNEVWLIAAGGAMFAAFPAWYAALWSGFYLEAFLILFALILRGAAFEFRGQREDPRWRRSWEWMIFFGSALPSFLWGVILGNLIQGLPIDANQNYVGTILTSYNPFALLCGVTLMALFTLHGAIFLHLRVSGELLSRAQNVAKGAWIATFVLFVVAGIIYATIENLRTLILDPRIVPLTYVLLGALFVLPWLITRGRTGWAFSLTAGIIVLSGAIIGLCLFPHLLVSNLNPAWSLTVANAASSPYTLTVVSWIALTVLPFVLLYQGWNYWVFRKRIQPHELGHY